MMKNGLYDLSGKTALITGGARGIGRAIAEAFTAAGADVGIVDCRFDQAEETARQLASRNGATAAAFAADVTDLETVMAMRDAALRRFGQIDILVNNAGWDRLTPFLKTTPQLWDRIIGINYRGVLNTCYAVLPHMVERKQGAIVNISSDSARVGSLGEAVYAGAKAGIIAFSKTLAREHARDNIRVNVVCPGLVETPLLEEMHREEFPHKVLTAVTGAIPLKRIGRPEDIAPTVVFLASGAAGYVTGQVLSVNGGLTMAG
jgi:2-hydroxycyclohexanecarboxyl-CoA dehydrogenase